MNQELKIILSSLIESYEPRIHLCNDTMRGLGYEKCYRTDCNFCPLAGGTYYNYFLIYLKKGYHE